MRKPQTDEVARGPGTGESMAVRDFIQGTPGRSYKSNHENWEQTLPAERGAEPTLGLPSRYELTFYDQERKMSSLADGQIGLLYCL